MDKRISIDKVPNEPEIVRWTVSIPRETDVAVRTHLAQVGLRKGDLSKFVADAVRWRLFNLNLEQARSRNRDVESRQLEDAIELALAEVRAQRFRNPL
jgi:Ribbon-helix-helix domain